jgi:hypothetical protein
MEYYFDTSSLVALARYYHPFDKDGRLFEFVRNRFQNKEIIVLDAILNETKYTSKGIALKAYPFIEEQKDLIVDTKELMPYSTIIYLQPKTIKIEDYGNDITVKPTTADTIVLELNTSFG